MLNVLDIDVRINDFVVKKMFFFCFLFVYFLKLPVLQECFKSSLQLRVLRHLLVLTFLSFFFFLSNQGCLNRFQMMIDKRSS